MTTECETLELAAKAMGHAIRFVFQGNGAGEAITYREKVICEKRWQEGPDHGGWTEWAPRTSDADCFALMVAREIDVEYFTGYVSATDANSDASPQRVKHNGTTEDRSRAVREAVLAVAAEIGRSK